MSSAARPQPFLSLRHSRLRPPSARLFRLLWLPVASLTPATPPSGRPSFRFPFSFDLWAAAQCHAALLLRVSSLTTSLCRLLPGAPYCVGPRGAGAVSGVRGVRWAHGLARRPSVLAHGMSNPGMTAVNESLMDVRQAGRQPQPALLMLPNPSAIPSHNRLLARRQSHVHVKRAIGCNAARRLDGPIGPSDSAVHCACMSGSCACAPCPPSCAAALSLRSLFRRRWGHGACSESPGVFPAGCSGWMACIGGRD